jgi:hypothetical protein
MGRASDLRPIHDGICPEQERVLEWLSPAIQPTLLGQRPTHLRRGATKPLAPHLAKAPLRLLGRRR